MLVFRNRSPRAAVQPSVPEGNVLNEALVDSHLKGVPGLGTLTAGSLAGGDLEGLGWETDWALDAEVLGLGAVDELGADLLKGLDVAGGEGDADLVGFLRGVVRILIFREPPVPSRRRRRRRDRLKEQEDILGPRRTPSLASGKT